MRTRLVGLGLSLLLCVATPALAQVVRGTVTDRATNKPITGGDVVLLLQRLGVAQAETDDDGHFELLAPSAGRYRIQFQAPGYRLVISPEFEVRAGESIDFPFRASVLPPVALDTTIVEGQPVPRYLADFYARRSAGFGRFVTRQEFDRYNPQQVTDILRHSQAFDITINRNQGGILGDHRTLVINSRRGLAAPVGPFGGDCPPLIFLDGAYVGNARDADVDAVIAVGTIEAMEMYEGGVEVPPEFGRNGSSCGVIAVWSRVAGGESAPVKHRIQVGSQFGGRLGNGFESGRVGVQASASLIGRFEGYAVFNQYLVGLHGPAVPRSGWEITLALRARPLGSGSPWYVGAGVTTLNIRDQSTGSYSPVISDEHQVLLAGVNLPVAWIRPLFEVRLQDPWTASGRQVQMFTGLTVRLQ